MQSLGKSSRLLAMLALAVGGILAAQPRPQISPTVSRQDFLRKFNAAALERTQHVVRYDSA
jgi:hypothetical protein